MSNRPAYLYALIVGCEAAFWLLLVLALVARYVFRRNRLSRALLLALPGVDVLLLAFTALDLRAGASASFAHGLATAYAGFTIAFGSVVVEATDQRFAHAGASRLVPYRVRLRLPLVRVWVRVELAPARRQARK